MKKVLFGCLGVFIFIVVAIVVIVLLLRSSGDFRDKSGKELEKFRPFFEYTFDKDFEIEIKEVETANSFDYVHTQYSIRYNDSNGVTRNFMFLTTSDTEQSVIREVERSMVEVLKYELNKKYIEPVITGSYTMRLSLIRYLAEEKKINRDLLISTKYGPKLSNLNEFMKGNGKDVYKTIFVSMTFKNQDDLLNFEKNVDEITGAFEGSIGPNYDVLFRTSLDVAND